jgi:hypothetical protein
MRVEMHRRIRAGAGLVGGRRRSISRSPTHTRHQRATSVRELIHASATRSTSVDLSTLSSRPARLVARCVLLRGRGVRRCIAGPPTRHRKFDAIPLLAVRRQRRDAMSSRRVCSVLAIVWLAASATSAAAQTPSVESSEHLRGRQYVSKQRGAVHRQSQTPAVNRHRARTSGVCR